MPIIIKNFTWTQSDTHVRVSVPLKAANRRSQLDLFTQPTFIKVNAHPDFIELFLCHPIDAQASTTKVYENEIKFVLLKQQPGVEWPSLERAIDKAATVSSKGTIIDEAHQLAEQAAKERQRQAYELRQQEIHKEIERESAIRKSAEAVHSDAFGEEMRAVDGMMKEKPNPLIPVRRAIKKATPKPVPAPAVVVPKVRTVGKIGVQFSERIFPTPLRESQEGAEQEWILKQNEARKAIGFIEEDLRPEERNVDWLKAKGKDFYAKGNYLGAVSALSTAIRMNPKCYDLYLNRATCHYSLENFNRCVEDASSAYELLVPAVPSNLISRSQCLAKRGAGLCKLGYMRQGHDELVAAAKLVPDNESLRKDIETVEAALRETAL